MLSPDCVTRELDLLSSLQCHSCSPPLGPVLFSRKKAFFLTNLDLGSVFWCHRVAESLRVQTCSGFSWALSASCCVWTWWKFKWVLQPLLSEVCHHLGSVPEGLNLHLILSVFQKFEELLRSDFSQVTKGRWFVASDQRNIMLGSKVRYKQSSSNAKE